MKAGEKVVKIEVLFSNALMNGASALSSSPALGYSV
jgi:hypothetical protein